MLSNLTQYSPRDLIPQFPGLQAAGLPQMPQGLFGQAQGQPSPYNGQGQFGHESQNPFFASPFGSNPYLQSPWLQNPGSHNPLQSSFSSPTSVSLPVQQLVPVFAQLAQQIAFQSAIAQQIGIAIHQLAHQLATQGPGAGQAFVGGGQHFGGAAQPFGLGGPLHGNPGPQYFGPNSFSNTPQGGYGGFYPQQSQGWGANRPQTIQ
jgi:hypothetical protein